MATETQQVQVSELIGAGKLYIGDGYRAKNSELSHEGVPFARAGNIKDGFQFQGADYFPSENLARVGNKLSQPGDVVFTSKGTVGRFAFVRIETPRFVYSPQLCFWRSLDPEVIDPQFLYYWMSGGEFYVQFKGVSGQTDMAEYVSLGDQRCMYITLPPISEQRSIASVLGELDQQIDLLRKTNATLEAMAHALFKSWFVDFDPVRVKVDGGVPSGMDAATAKLLPDRFVDSDLGQIPRGWRVAPLDSVAEFLNGLAMQKYPPGDGGSLPVIKIAQLRDEETKGADRATDQLPEKYIIHDGDLIFSWSGSLTVVLWTGGRGGLNQHLFKVTADGVPRWFVWQWLLYHLPAFQQIAADKATTMGHIQRRHLTAAMVLVPEAELLSAMTRIMQPLMETIVQNKIEARQLARQRDTLLPKLLSGDISPPAVAEEATR